MKPDFCFRTGLAFAALVVSGGPSFGGSFISDFNSGPPGGASVYGNAFVDATGGVADSGVLKLTTATASQVGSFVIDDLDPGLRIAAFTASFKLRMGGGTSVPADGISFNFASDLPNSAFNEEGAGTGLTVVFDAYDNGTGDNPEGPELRIKVGGAIIASHKLTNHLRTGTNFVNVQISYTAAGTLNVVYNGQTFFTNLFIFGPLTTGCRFGFGARTGGLNQDQFVDDLSIATTPMAGFYVKGNITPFPSWNAPSTTPFNLVLSDFVAAVDPSSVTLSFNGLGVRPSVIKNAALTTISYTPATVLLSNSLNHIKLTFSDSSGPATHVLDYDFTVGPAPLWSLAPGSRPYISTDLSSTPFQRSLGYNALSNQLYVISRTGAGTGLTINVLDADTGADLYQLNTNGITGGSIILLGLGVADDGAIYAANMVAPNTGANPLKVYRWANSAPSTAPSVVFTGDPANPANTTFRWGDSFTVTGAGTNTRLMLDATNASTVAVLAPSDSFLTNFASAAYTHAYAGNTVGRSLQFGPTNTFFLKKKSTANPPVAQPWQLIRFDNPPATTVLMSMPDFHPQVGPVAADLPSGLAAGIFFTTNTAAPTPDRLVVFNISNLASPFQIAQYNFPANHQPNANFIGSVVFGGGKIFALEGNNGLIIVPAVPPIMPFLSIGTLAGGARLSWTNPIPRFVLQSSPVIAPASWTTIPGSNLGPNTITDTFSGGAKFYRLVKP